MPVESLLLYPIVLFASIMTALPSTDDETRGTAFGVLFLYGAILLLVARVPSIPLMSLAAWWTLGVSGVIVLMGVIRRHRRNHTPPLTAL